MANTISPNMNLVIPGVGTEAGPTYAFDINASLTLVDVHDHSPGQGIQITPAGLNINADLSLKGNNLTLTNSVVFQSQATNNTLLGLYVSPGTESPSPINDLWFNDGVGNKIQITAGGQVNATIASIPGESYAFGTFTWRQGTGSTVPANFDIGSITLRPNIAATTNGVLLSASGVVTNYTLNMLPSLPGVQSFLTVDSSGALGAGLPTSLGITAANISNHTISDTQIVVQGISAASILNATLTTTQIAAATILGSNIAAATVTPGNLSVPTTWNGSFVGPTDYSSGSNTIINISSFQPIVGRPIFYNFSSSTTSGGNVRVGTSSSCTISIQAGLTVIFKQFIRNDNASSTDSITFPISTFNCFTPGVSVGAAHNTLLIVSNITGVVTLDNISMNVMQI